MPETIDLLLGLLLAVGLPVLFLFTDRQFARRLEAGDPSVRLKDYALTMAILWLSTGLAVATWLLKDREWADLALTATQGWRFWTTLGVALVIGVLLELQVHKVARDEEARRAVAEQFANVSDFLPQTEREVRSFVALSVTAGITEEILFRGYLIWLLSFWMNPWFAGALALVPFAACHAYQGMQGMIRVAAVGAVLTAMVLFCGSLIPVILLHAAIDVTQGRMAWASR